MQNPGAAANSAAAPGQTVYYRISIGIFTGLISYLTCCVICFLQCAISFFVSLMYIQMQSMTCIVVDKGLDNPI